MHHGHGATPLPMIHPASAQSNHHHDGGIKHEPFHTPFFRSVSSFMDLLLALICLVLLVNPPCFFTWKTTPSLDDTLLSPVPGKEVVQLRPKE